MKEAKGFNVLLVLVVGLLAGYFIGTYFGVSLEGKATAAAQVKSGDTILIESVSKSYCTAEERVPTHYFNCNEGIPGPNEQFVISKVSGKGAISSGDAVTLRSVNLDLLCFAEQASPSSVHPIECSKNLPDSFAEFVVSKIAGDGAIIYGESVSLKSNSNKYCSVTENSGTEDDGNYPVECISSSVEINEKFKLSLVSSASK